jgi:hypothetical protein
VIFELIECVHSRILCTTWFIVVCLCGYFQKRIRLMIGVLILTLFVDNASDAKISFDRVAWHPSGHSCWNL